MPNALRGEISNRDGVALVGHSTGGLDIRWLLWDLHHRKHPIVVDGEVKVEPEKILNCVRRVVFLSVPHWGTNIADWVQAQGTLRKAVIRWDLPTRRENWPVRVPQAEQRRPIRHKTRNQKSTDL